MNIRAGGRWAIICAAALMSLGIVPSARAEDPLLRGTGARVSFDLTTYREMKKSDHAALALILSAMRETVFYAQHAIGGPVICASPRPIPVAELIEIVDKEIAAPSNPSIREYPNNESMAFIFVSGLKKAAFCE